MNNTQFNRALARLGINQGDAARLLGCTIRTVNGYANGKPIPITVERFLNLLLETNTPAEKYL